MNVNKPSKVVVNEIISLCFAVLYDLPLVFAEEEWLYIIINGIDLGKFNVFFVLWVLISVTDRTLFK